jgi:hypothetical protein
LRAGKEACEKGSGLDGNGFGGGGKGGQWENAKGKIWLSVSHHHALL